MGGCSIKLPRETALCVPVFIDFDRKRSGKARTWRQLTVAENLQILPRDVAVAFHLQIGARQWVIYRSLAATASRTFLGQNITSEFVVASSRPTARLTV